MHIPDHFTETYPGVYERTEQNDSQSGDILDHYTNDAEKILRNDLRHYTKFAPKLGEVLDDAGINCEHVVAFGGGHPKLEATAGFRNITVVDGMADTYKQHAKLFNELYLSDWQNVTYVQRFITAEMIRKMIWVGTCTFVHFLEHMTAEMTRDILRAVIPHDIIIYGPNIRAARDGSWFHFKPIDHNTFWTGEALCGYLQDIGYTTTLLEYSDDYLITGKHNV